VWIRAAFIHGRYQTTAHLAITFHVPISLLDTDAFRGVHGLTADVFRRSLRRLE